MTHLRLRAFGIVAAFSLSACAGTGTTAIPRGPQNESASPSVKRTVPVRFTMHWPARRTRVRTARGFAWISPSTASAIVEVTGASTSGVTFANEPHKSRTSSIEIAAPPGLDTFTISLYDTPQKAGESAPAGNELGQATVSQKIVASEANVVRATIAGIVARVSLAPAANQPLVESLGSGNGYAVVGDQPQTFVVAALDADGNVIVPQPSVDLKAPKYQEGAIGGGVTLTYFDVKPVRRKPGTFLVNASQPDRTDLGGTFYQKLSLVASATDALGDKVSASIPMQELSAFYVLYTNPPPGSPPIALYDANGNLVRLGPAAFAGLQTPVAIAYDYTAHHVVIADRGAGQILAFDGAGNALPHFGPILMSDTFEPQSLAYDPNLQQIYASSPLEVRAFTASGAAVGGASQRFENTYPAGQIAYISGDNSISLAAQNGNTVDTYDESGTYLNETSTIPVTTIAALASDPKSNDQFVAGTPSQSGGYDLFINYPGDTPNAFNSATVTNPLALGVDRNSNELYVLSAAPDRLTPVFYSTIGVHFGTVDTAHVISGNANYAGPIGFAVTY